MVKTSSRLIPLFSFITNSILISTPLLESSLTIRNNAKSYLSQHDVHHLHLPLGRRNANPQFRSTSSSHLQHESRTESQTVQTETHTACQIEFTHSESFIALKKRLLFQQLTVFRLGYDYEWHDGSPNMATLNKIDLEKFSLASVKILLHPNQWVLFYPHKLIQLKKWMLAINF